MGRPWENLQGRLQENRQGRLWEIRRDATGEAEHNHQLVEDRAGAGGEA